MLFRILLESCRGQQRGAGGGAHCAGLGQNGWTPLHYAAESGHLGVAERLLGAGASIDARDKVRDPGGRGRRGCTISARTGCVWRASRCCV